MDRPASGELLIEDAPGVLVDSTPVLADPAALRSELAEHSCILLRSLLPRRLVEDLGALVTQKLVENGWVADAGLVPLTPVPMAGEDAYWNAYTAIIGEESLHRLAHHEALLAVARDVIGEPQLIVHPRKIPRLCIPHALAPLRTTPAHQDHPYTQGGVDGLAIWIPLTPTPRERGALAVLDGSASDGIRPIRVGGEDYPCVPAQLDHDAAVRRTWLSTDFDLGDVLVFHPLTVHAALPNRTDVMRLSVDFRYRALSEPIGLTETWPPFHPHLGWWDEMTRGWESTAWVELPRGTRVKGVRPPQRGLTVPASRLVGSAPNALEPGRPSGLTATIG